MIPMRAAGWPDRPLLFQRPNNGGIIGELGVLIERTDACRMRKQLREGDIHLPVLPKFRPEFRNAPFGFDFVLLERVKQTRAADSFGCRPDQRDRVVVPGLLSFSVAKSLVQIEYRFAVLPDGDGCT